MAKEMLINVSAGEECRIAVVENGKLEELYMERASAVSHVGNVYKGKVTNVEASIQAAFIDFGIGRNGFLHVSDLMPAYWRGDRGDGVKESVGRKLGRRDRPPIQQCLRRGDEIVVQVIKEGLGTKGPTLSSYLSIPGRILVMMPGVGKSGVSKKIEDEDERRRLRKILDELNPPKDAGFIIRTAGIGKAKQEIERDFKYLTRLWENIQDADTRKGPLELYAEGDLVMRTVRDVYTSDIERIVVDDEQTARRIKDFFKLLMPRTRNKVEVYEGTVPLFHAYEIEAGIEQMHSRTVPLPSGGSLIIDQTEAVTAIDVNSGKSRASGDAETTAFKTDLEAADEIPRQLKLRDLGGIVICDFIDLRFDRHRRELEERLANNLKRDRAKTRFLAMSEFGIIEMTRQRMRPSLKKSVFQDCPNCGGHGLVKTPESMGLDVIRRIAIAANNDRVRRVELSLHPDVAVHVLNRKRVALADLEEDTGKRIIIKTDSDLPLDQMHFELFDDRDGAVWLSVLGMEPPQHQNGGNGRGRDERGGRGRRDDRRREEQRRPAELHREDFDDETLPPPRGELPPPPKPASIKGPRVLARPPEEESEQDEESYDAEHESVDDSVDETAEEAAASGAKADEPALAAREPDSPRRAYDIEPARPAIADEDYDDASVDEEPEESDEPSREAEPVPAAGARASDDEHESDDELDEGDEHDEAFAASDDRGARDDRGSRDARGGRDDRSSRDSGRSGRPAIATREFRDDDDAEFDDEAGDRGAGDREPRYDDRGRSDGRDRNEGRDRDESRSRDEGRSRDDDRRPGDDDRDYDDRDRDDRREPARSGDSGGGGYTVPGADREGGNGEGGGRRRRRRRRGRRGRGGDDRQGDPPRQGDSQRQQGYGPRDSYGPRGNEPGRPGIYTNDLGIEEFADDDVEASDDRRDDNRPRDDRSRDQRDRGYDVRRDDGRRNDQRGGGEQRHRDDRNRGGERGGERGRQQEGGRRDDRQRNDRGDNRGGPRDDRGPSRNDRGPARNDRGPRDDRGNRGDDRGNRSDDRGNRGDDRGNRGPREPQRPLAVRPPERGGQQDRRDEFDDEEHEGPSPGNSIHGPETHLRSSIETRQGRGGRRGRGRGGKGGRQQPDPRAALPEVTSDSLVAKFLEQPVEIGDGDDEAEMAGNAIRPIDAPITGGGDDQQQGGEGGEGGRRRRRRRRGRRGRGRGQGGEFEGGENRIAEPAVGEHDAADSEGGDRDELSEDSRDVGYQVPGEDAAVKGDVEPRSEDEPVEVEPTTETVAVVEEAPKKRTRRPRAKKAEADATEAPAEATAPKAAKKAEPKTAAKVTRRRGKKSEPVAGEAPRTGTSDKHAVDAELPDISRFLTAPTSPDDLEPEYPDDDE